MAARPIVDLPAPDSPIRPRISPRLSSASILSTSTAPLIVSTLSCSRWSTYSGALIDASSHFRLRARGPGVDRQEPIDDKIDADRQGRDGESGIKRREQAEIDRRGVLADHAAPIRIGRLDADAEKTQRRDKQEVEAEAQAEFRHQRRRGVGENLARDDPPQAFAAQARRLDEFEHDDVLAERTGETEDARSEERRVGKE